MFAIFETGGKQYKVETNEVIYTEKLEGKSGDKIIFDKVLMINDKIGTPFIKGASVTCTIDKQGKQKKLDIIKFRSQKHHMKRQGHRQPYTKLIVNEIKE